VLGRSAERARSSEAVKRRRDLERLGLALAAYDPARARRRDLERLGLALAAHDPARTLERGYALVADRSGQPLGSAAAARAAAEIELRFHDGAVPARVTEDS
jgi:exodeoxyribonuclease VII large subunit